VRQALVELEAEKTAPVPAEQHYLENQVVKIKGLLSRFERELAGGGPLPLVHDRFHGIGQFVADQWAGSSAFTSTLMAADNAYRTAEED
jgi:hypothetical protein